ncbi:MAG: response regulator, partial [Pseudomonadota bacterium]
MKILVVDDDVDTCEILSDIFQERGYSVITAGTGNEAIDKASQTTFDAALIDIKLPDMDGMELIVALKGMQADMVVVMITGYASIETAVRALSEGVSAYILKPLNMDEVLATVRETLEKRHLVVENRRLLHEIQQELAERKQTEEKLTHLNSVLWAIRN